MRCKWVQQHLLDYSDKLLDLKTHILIEQHLHSCNECRQELNEIERTIQLLRSVSLEEPPEAFWPDFTSSVMRKIHNLETVPAVRRVVFFSNFKMALIAVVLLVIIGSLFLL